NTRIGNWVEKLIREMVKANIAPEFIREIMQQIQGFSSYGFPESHAASFALLAYASSYLKCHYPAPFFTAILNAQPMGFYQSDTLIKTARHCGVTVRPVCIQHSEWDSQLELITPGMPGIYAIRLGLRLVRGINETEIRHFVNKRNSGDGYASFEALVHDNHLSRTDLSALSAAGAFAIFGMVRKNAIWKSEAAPYDRWTTELEKGAYMPRIQNDPAVAFAPESEMASVESDYRAMRTSLGRHMAELVKEQAWVYQVPVGQVIDSAQLASVSPNRFVVVFGLVQVRQSPGTANKMLFVTLEDEKGTIPVVIRPKVYAKYAGIIDQQSFLCLLGRLQANGDRFSVLASQVFAPLPKKATVIPVEQEKNVERITAGDYLKARNYM
ncbi:MAG: hypothetical protein KKB59_20010, partial [Spirochaetes bacterium]|nr:hypothetical protein [Spirochaetota bacterium]